MLPGRQDRRMREGMRTEEQGRHGSGTASGRRGWTERTGVWESVRVRIPRPLFPSCGISSRTTHQPPGAWFFRRRGLLVTSALPKGPGTGLVLLRLYRELRRPAVAAHSASAVAEDGEPSGLAGKRGKTHDSGFKSHHPFSSTCCLTTTWALQRLF